MGIQLFLTTYFYISFPLRPSLILHENSNRSLVVQVSFKTSSCWTNATILPKSPLFKVRPFTHTLPLQYEPSQRDCFCERSFRSEVLPEPLGPMMATISPGLTYPAAHETTCLIIFFLCVRHVVLANRSRIRVNSFWLTFFLLLL